jgi:hypothetical protein
LQSQTKNAEAKYALVLKEASTGAETGQAYRDFRKAVTKAALSLLPILEDTWLDWPEAEPISAAAQLADSVAEPSSLQLLREHKPVGRFLWIGVAEELYAVRLTNVIHHVFAQMRNFLACSLAGFILALATISSYPMQPRHTLLAFAWMFGVVCIGVTIWAFADMDRDALLSYIGKSTPGSLRLSGEFVRTVLTYGVLPLLALAATQFPGLGDDIGSFLGSLLRPLR